MLDNSLTELLLKSVREAMDEGANQKGFQLGQNNFRFLSERGKYVMNVNRHFNRICSIIEDLDKIEIFLRRFSGGTFLKENGINQLAYTQYHIEVLIHKIHTILEIKKLMINEVYEFGIAEKDCSWDLLKNKIKSKNIRLYNILNSYYAVFKQIIEARHLNTHRGIFNDIEKDDLDRNVGIYEGFKKLGLEIDDEFKEMMPRFVLDWQVKNYRKSKLKLVRESRKHIENFAKIFFDSLSKEFKKRKEIKKIHGGM